MATPTEIDVQQIVDFNLDMKFEQIIHCFFLEDINPNYILVLTYNEYRCTSFIYIFKIVKKTKEEKKEEKGHDQAYKQRLSKSILQNPDVFKLTKYPYEENYELTIDERKARVVNTDLSSEEGET